MNRQGRAVKGTALSVYRERKPVRFHTFEGYIDSMQLLLDRLNTLTDSFDMQEIAEISRIIASIKKNADIRC